MTQENIRPAWSAQFSEEAIRELVALGPIGEISRDWAWGNSTGKGIRVAVIDSGIEADHPAVGGSVKGGVVIEMDAAGSKDVQISEEKTPIDLFGHGTACAGIIHGYAPEAEIFSVRVLGKNLTGKALQFAAGLRWAIDNDMHIVNLSLSTSRAEYYSMFHELADEAYFRNILLVSAANNLPTPSYPSLYSSVISVAAHDAQDPFTYFYNPTPPVEFGAPGINIEVAWRDKGTSVSTGNSFAAPHIAGIVTLIRAKHPDLTPFQIKTILFSCATNTQTRSSGIQEN